MKLYAPEYYKKFRCIADRCDHSCCIGWEIDIDSDTLAKYKELDDNGYGSVIKKSICFDKTPYFKLCDGDRCPHLSPEGLCRIILTLGEAHLCDICREHPRFYNFTDIAELGIGMSCTEAARVVLSSPHYDSFIEIGELDAVKSDVDFDARAERGKIYEVLKDCSVDYPSRLERIYAKYGVCLNSDSMWLEIIDSLEYLNVDHKELFMKYSSKKRPTGADVYLERALAHFIYRHCTEACDLDDFSERLGFCLFCERLLASLIDTCGAESLSEIATLAGIISEEIEYSNDNTLSLMY